MPKVNMSWQGHVVMMQTQMRGADSRKLYPDLIKLGGLAKALPSALDDLIKHGDLANTLRAIWAETRSSLTVSELSKPPGGWLGLVGGAAHDMPILFRVELASRFSQLQIAAHERLFLFDFWNREVMLAAGQTPDLGETARAILRWVVSDCSSGNLAAEFGFVWVEPEAPSHERGKEVEHRWRHGYASIALKIGDQLSLWLLLAADGTVNRMGTGDVDHPDRHMFIGKTQEPLFRQFIENVPDDVLSHPGVYNCSAEHRGKESKLEIIFSASDVFCTSDRQEIGLRFLYGSESIGPPPVICELVYYAVNLTEPWLQQNRKEAASRAGNLPP